MSEAFWVQAYALWQSTARSVERGSVVAELYNHLPLGSHRISGSALGTLEFCDWLRGGCCQFQLLLQKVLAAIGTCLHCGVRDRSWSRGGFEAPVGTLPSDRLMHSPGSTVDEIETITVRIANLELTITAREVGDEAAAGSGTRVVEVAAPATNVQAVRDPSEFLDPFGITVELEEQSLDATTSVLLSQLPLPFLATSVGRLRGTHPIWTPRCRVARAFRAGVIARRRLDGQVLDHSSVAIPYRNTYYIVLRGRGNSEGFWTCNYGIYIAGVADQNGRNSLHPDTISHGFPTHAESAAYLCGARRSWPREQ